MVPDLCPTTDKIFTHLISGYQLPLRPILSKKNKTVVLFFAISTKNSDIQVSKLKGLTKIANIILLEGLQQISVLTVLRVCIYLFH
jgi:hypothetical protein